MSSGQPKATSNNVSVGRYVMLDQYPYKPFKVTTVTDTAIWLSNPSPHIRATRAFTLDEFDEAVYVFAEEHPNSKGEQ